MNSVDKHPDNRNILSTLKEFVKKNKYTILIILLFGIVGVAMWYTYSGYGKLHGKQAKKMIENGCIRHVIDVRTTMEWNNGHYDGAIHIPTADIDSTIANVIQDNAGVLTYCNTGQRARIAAEKIRKYISNPVFYLTDSYTLLES